MTDPSADPAAGQPAGQPAGQAGSVPPERRVHEALRTLVEEMLTQIRETAQQDLWTADERARAEEDLERVMAQVRREALSDRYHG